jgi:hypothetical protein
MLYNPEPPTLGLSAGEYFYKIVIDFEDLKRMRRFLGHI